MDRGAPETEGLWNNFERLAHEAVPKGSLWDSDDEAYDSYGIFSYLHISQDCQTLDQ